jgi:hypothetical protein
MRAEVLKVTPEACEARTESELLVVFRRPANQEMRLGDVLEFESLALDSDVRVKNSARGYEFIAHIQARDIHDLRLASDHDSDRTPSEERLREG